MSEDKKQTTTQTPPRQETPGGERSAAPPREEFPEGWSPWREWDLPESVRDWEPEERESPRRSDQRRRSGTGFGWMPDACRPVEERGQRNQQDWEAI